MKLYNFAFSPNSRKVRAVIYELGLDVELVTVDLIRGGNRAPEFLAINPNGKAPVLEDGDFVLWESNAIIAYLATKNRAKVDLCPAEPRERAEVDRWLDWQLAHLGPAIGKVGFERIVKKLQNLGEPDAKAIEVGVREFATFTTVLETSLGTREYVAERLSVADFALASHYVIADACGLDMQPYPRVRAWLGRVLARESMRRANEDAKAALASQAA
jgi:glutathione S-transferase